STMSPREPAENVVKSDVPVNRRRHGSRIIGPVDVIIGRERTMPQVTISKVMLEHAALAVETARTQFRINLDFSATSLSEVDRILSALYFNRDRGLMAKLLSKNQEQELREQAKTWGGYVGETLRRKWGGTWHTSVLEGGEIQIYLRLFGSNAYPIDEVYKRLVSGPQQQSLLGLHEIA